MASRHNERTPKTTQHAAHSAPQNPAEQSGTAQPGTTAQDVAPQTGATVQGYRTLSEADIANMNRLKEASRAFLLVLQDVHESEPDGRWVAMAKTSMQQACMFACRAIAKPSDDS